MAALPIAIAACERGTDNGGMEIFSPAFFSSLAAIIVIDLMLAGDNAIVIALAARGVPAHLRNRAIAWGIVGAVLVRCLLTLIVVWLLQVPGLLFAGGAVLVWIAYKLLLPEQSTTHSHTVAAAAGFWGAMRTIVIADAVMGLDNVLAVAGAAHGSYVLVVLGLIISVPIVVAGSRFLLAWVERYPVIVYFGSAVLAWTAAKMMASEPLLRETLAEEVYLEILLYVVLIIGVLLAGFLHNHRRLESRIHARLAELRAPSTASPDVQSKEGISMQSVLVPIGPVRNVEFAIRRVVTEYLRNSEIEIHLLNVQAPFSRHIGQWVSRRAADDFHRERAEVSLAPARALLDRRGIPYAVHIRTGDRAAVIAAEAKRLECDHIVMSTARKNSLTRMLEDSTTNRVLELTSVPVELVAGEEVSKLERYGVPASVGALLALIFAAAAE
jgi:YjbE family integral membrane protein